MTGPRQHAVGRRFTLAKRADGFTMVELLVALVITTAIMGTIVLLTTQLQASYRTQLDGAAVQQEARYALDWITRALAEAGSNPFGVATSDCPVADTMFQAIQRDPNGDAIQSDIRIHADIGPPNGLLGGLGGVDGCPEGGEDITIAHDPVAQVITRQDLNLDANPVPVSDSVITGLAFAYLDKTRTATAVDANVAFVQVTVTATTPVVDRATGQPTSFILSSEVGVRVR